MKIKGTHWLGMIVGLVMTVTVIIIFGNTYMTYFLLVIALIISVIPFVASLVSEQNKQHEKETMFLAFSRDLVESVKSGTPISKAIINLRNRNYGALSPHIYKLANQVSLGITLNEALRTFAKETDSKVISRAVSLISEAERAGGKIETILESVSLSVNQIDKLKKERKSAISNLVVQGYIIFIVFIVIMIVLEFKILPLVSGLSGAEGMMGGKTTKPIDPDQFSFPLLVTILVQSFFAGLVVGKISEGTIKSGVKHSFILLAITLLLTMGAKAFFN
jgi:archaeal flagellar protein FlaJ